MVQSFPLVNTVTKLSFIKDKELLEQLGHYQLLEDDFAL
jgi:hypothetical protein